MQMSITNNKQKTFKKDKTTTAQDDKPMEYIQKDDEPNDEQPRGHKKKAVRIVDTVRLEALDTESAMYEVDENNFIHGIHAEVCRECPPLPKSTLPNLPPTQLVKSEKPWPPVWRSQKEIAIEVSEFKEALALHDLVDNDNVELMVMKPGHAILQAVWDTHMEELVRTIMQAIAPGDDAHPMVSITRVDGIEAQLNRLRRRRGPLVNIHYQRTISTMCRKKEKKITSQWINVPMDQNDESPSSSPQCRHVVVVEIRNADLSPADELKPGRRLVPWHEVHKGDTARCAYRLDSHGDFPAYVTTGLSV
ncbi:hypothetical protein F5B20DRAFT_132151 [Whalleya microplaca]|nr:hypothetical protein F5B20DRAFT_132151 [Whalleya microplaca]